MSNPTGYDKLSGFMINEKYAIFRQFKIQAIRDLLFLQAELVQLENDFQAIRARDRDSTGEEKLYDLNWYMLSTSKDRDHSGEQWSKALEIRLKLKEYYECVSRYSTIPQMPQARRRDVIMLKSWIERPDLGGGIGFSGGDLGLGRSVYDGMFSDDLMILDHRGGENDPFTRCLSGPVFNCLERLWRYFKKPVPLDAESPEKKSNLFHYSDALVLGTIDILGTVIASMIPLISIVILYYVQNMGARLGVVCACTLIFSTGLALVTKARRIEIFACSLGHSGTLELTHP